MSNIKEYVYDGPLSHLILNYVNEKRGMGIEFNAAAKRLKNFDKFTKSYQLSKNTLSKELILDYIKKYPNQSNSTCKQKMIIVNGFANYLVRLGYDAYIIPNSMFKIKTSTFIPYIFSEDEIYRFFASVNKIKPSSQNRRIHLVSQLVFRMLYSCGFRISEVTNLTINDANLENGVITIKETKFNKSRLVPMSKSLWEDCIEYYNQIHKESQSSFPFFPNRYNTFYTTEGIYDLFRKILWNAGISHGGKGKGPRLHDLRHTFAVHCLKKWSLDGTDMTVALPYLSSFMGHTSLQSTQKYLRLTADLFPDIIKKLDAKFSYLIPDIKDGDYNG
jgi:integrase